jgi:hypothetical protein
MTSAHRFLLRSAEWLGLPSTLQPDDVTRVARRCDEARADYRTLIWSVLAYYAWKQAGRLLEPPPRSTARWCGRTAAVRERADASAKLSITFSLVTDVGLLPYLTPRVLVSSIDATNQQISTDLGVRRLSSRAAAYIGELRPKWSKPAVLENLRAATPDAVHGRNLLYRWFMTELSTRPSDVRHAAIYERYESGWTCARIGAYFQCAKYKPLLLDLYRQYVPPTAIMTPVDVGHLTLSLPVGVQ